MCPMETNAQHYYVFEVTGPSSNSPMAPVKTGRVRVLADSHAEALNVVSVEMPSSSRIAFAAIDPGPKLCTDRRCAVCYPSRRNGGQ